MDKLVRYRNLIKGHIRELVELVNRHPTPGIENLCLFDEESDQYMMVKVGWRGNHRVRGTTLYVRLRNGKIWIEEDWTEEGIGNALLRADVPREDIVLAFHPPSLRHLTEFAVA